MSSSGNSEEDPWMEGIPLMLVNVGSLMEKQVLQQATSSSGNGEHHLQGLIKQFLKLKPPIFVGVENPKGAEL